MYKDVGHMFKVNNKGKYPEVGASLVSAQGTKKSVCLYCSQLGRKKWYMLRLEL